MRFGIPTSAVAAALLAAALPSAAQAAQRLVDARQVSSDTLRDVAVATFERGRPIIYYNPQLMARLGPELSAFFLAHEYGHLYYGHTGAALADAGSDLGTVRQRQELAADCYATASLAEREPEAVRAALEFFNRMGPFRFDNLHPSGAQRAAKILACLPASGS
ncbi:MAG TPA: hypothetical protein VFK09_02540 [Gemmatimonadales bacterium]|jgi:Zn-dependent peptidase ImmA (M78 family)|nr:hypothetical protein [Gemmatimonadales bacterium]